MLGCRLALGLSLLAATSGFGFHPALPETRSLRNANGGGREISDVRKVSSGVMRGSGPQGCRMALVDRRSAAAALVLLPVWGLAQEAAWGDVGVMVSADPTQAQTQVIKDAFKAFDKKELQRAEELFTQGITTWETLQRPRDEMAELYKSRGNVRVDLKRFSEAKEDYDKVLGLMQDGEKADGTAAYMEYPDAFVQRGLSLEGLGDWNGAVKDYSKAISLWGGGRGDGINPYVLTFRANALTKLDKYQESIKDYAAAETLFLQQRDAQRALDARANRALALYETGDQKQAVKIMREIVRRSPGYADMHVALAAHAWSYGDRDEAETQWEFVCNNISVGCKKYKDTDWVRTVRRWPPSLVSRLTSFLGKT